MQVMRVLRFYGPVIVRFTALDKKAAGYHRYHDGVHEVAIADDLSPAEAARALCHELTHAAQAATSRSWPETYHDDPDRHEEEAELAANCLWRRVLLRA
jgi:hypothetical protein